MYEIIAFPPSNNHHCRRRFRNKDQRLEDAIVVSTMQEHNVAPYRRVNRHLHQHDEYSASVHRKFTHGATSAMYMCDKCKIGDSSFLTQSLRAKYMKSVHGACKMIIVMMRDLHKFTCSQWVIQLLVPCPMLIHNPTNVAVTFAYLAPDTTTETL